MIKNECIFCKIAKGEIPSEKIYENKNFFSVLDVHPILRGHSLVISKNHFDNLLELPDNLAKEMNNCVKETCIILTKKFNADGFNISINVNDAGEQLIKHFHIHVIPRKNKDGMIFALHKK